MIWDFPAKEKIVITGSGLELSDFAYLPRTDERWKK
jgi:hypothetical protein